MTTQMTRSKHSKGQISLSRHQDHLDTSISSNILVYRDDFRWSSVSLVVGIMLFLGELPRRHSTAPRCHRAPSRYQHLPKRCWILVLEPIAKRCSELEAMAHWNRSFTYEHYKKWWFSSSRTVNVLTSFGKQLVKFRGLWDIVKYCEILWGSMWHMYCQGIYDMWRMGSSI